jgi:hypothetical protein
VRVEAKVLDSELMRQRSFAAAGLLAADRR